jgi:hypothetical protein
MALNFKSSLGKRSNTITNLLKSDLALDTMTVAVAAVKSHMPLIFEAETSTTCSEENGEVCQML